MAEEAEFYQKVDEVHPIALTERQRATRELSDRLATARGVVLNRT